MTAGSGSSITLLLLPLHGTEYIVQAAGRLHNEREIEFVVAGKGSEHQKVRNLARRMRVSNIRFIDWLPYESLPLEIANSDICLGGHFSDIEKAKRVIAGKTYQFIAMKKPVIVGNGAGNRELFTHQRMLSWSKWLMPTPLPLQFWN